MTIPKKYEDRIEGYEHDNDGYWIYLTDDWITSDNDCHTIHEDTQQQALHELRLTRPVTALRGCT